MPLPLTDDEQHLLLSSLGELVEAIGPAPLLAAPLEPTPAFFPDRYVPTAGGARVVAERLLGYAGLTTHRCVVQVAESERDETGRGAAAWFTGIEGFRCFMGVDERNLGDAGALVASLAHEVAHAFRHHHRLAERGVLPEEPATDATTVFLGFGILTTVATERLRTSGDFDGTAATLHSSQSRLGYLPPQAMAFLLAAQALARRAGWRERRRLAGLLEPNQAALFRSAHAALRRREAEVLRLLRLPADRRGTPAPRPTRLVEQVLDPAPAPAAATPRRIDNSHRRVFRVRGRTRAAAAIVGAVLGAFPFSLWSLIAHRAWPLLPGAAAALWLGARCGRRRPDRCSDPECEAAQPAGAVVCPGCGGAIAGTLASADERLEAQERLAAGEDEAWRA